MIWLIRLALFLVPFALLWAFFAWRRRDPTAERESGWLLLFAAIGLAAMLGLGLALTLPDAAAPSAHYVPPREVDGRIVPGGFDGEHAPR